MSPADTLERVFQEERVACVRVLSWARSAEHSRDHSGWSRMDKAGSART